MPRAAARAAQFFRSLQAQGAVGLLTATSGAELFHVALQAIYRRALPTYQAQLARALPTKRRHTWQDLYKLRPDLIPPALPALERLRGALRANGLVFLQPEDLGSLPAGRPIETELLRFVGRYQLDTGDAAILLEAQRAGVFNIATMDADLQRAQANFDVYTWL